MTSEPGTDRSARQGSAKRTAVRVFISYAHDDAAHEDRVRAFWIFLRAQGVDARADFPAAERRQDWAEWMTQEVRDAHHVLVVASPEYRRRAEGDAGSSEGRGVQWEARLIRDRFYADQWAGLQAIVPVVLPGCSADDIPLWMGPTATTHYQVNEYTVAGAEKLLRLLTGQPLETEPLLGAVPILPPRHTEAPEDLDSAESGAGRLPSPLIVRYSLPPDTAGFTGRDEELDRIAAAVTEATQAGQLIAIHAIDGMPGVGKTALAVRAAYRLRHQFPDRQLFINLHGYTPGRKPVPPGAALAGLLTATGLEGRYLPDDLQGRIDLWRDRMAGLRALLVLDNASDSAQVAPLLPGGDHCLVLVTSRRHLGDLPGNAVTVLLEVLSVAQAQEMFLRLAPRAASEPEALVQELTRLAGYLPLAVSLLARVYARHPAWTVADLTHETKASMLTLAAEEDSVAAAFEVSYRYLNTAQKRLFRRLGLHPGTMIDAYAAAALAETSLQAASGHLETLHGEGLLTEHSYHRYGMHDLIHRYAHERATSDPVPGRQRALERLLDYYQYTAAIAEMRLGRQTPANRSPEHPVASPAQVPDLPDSTAALSWARTERANLLACLDQASQAGQHSRTIALTASMAAVLRQDGPWPDAITRHTAAVHAARYLGDRFGLANALNNLGIVRRLTGDFAGAAVALEEALAIHRDLGSQQGQANTLDQLGVLRRQTGDYASAAEFHQTALDIYRDLGDQLGRATALNNLGIVRRQTGDYAGAAEFHQTALGIYRDLGDRHGQANELTFLGAARAQGGNNRGAAQVLEQGLNIFRELGDRQGQVNALTFLGDVRQMTGDYTGAAEIAEEALGLSREIGDRLGEINALWHLGLARRLTGDFSGATAVLEEALSLSRLLGERVGQGNALMYLGAVRRLTGDYQASADNLQAALDIYRSIGDRAGEVEALNEVGTLHMALTELDEARACHRKALDLAREIASPWNEAQALAGLGRCALIAGHMTDARTYLQQSWQIFAQIGAAEAAALTAELDTCGWRG